jgi:acetyl esterase/lipase
MGIWIEPVPHLVVGQIKEWASSAGISAIRIPGYWHNKAGSNIAPNTSASPDEKIILKFHGGAYVAGSAIPDDPTANTVKGVLERATSVQRAFSVEYRLSVGPPFKPANGFPAALIDALAGYNHLVNVLSFQPENIIIEGDSAGGNLALALTMYLIGNRDTLADAALPGTKSLTSPGGLILCSPWADIGSSHDRPLQSYLARSDYVGNVRGSRSKYSNKAFLGSLGLPAADTNMYISPASKIITNISFAGWPRTLISCGGAEYLAPSIRTLKERMAVDMGEGSGAGQVSYCEVPDGIHDFLVFTWHEPERSQVLKIMADWVDK